MRPAIRTATLLLTMLASCDMVESCDKKTGREHVRGSLRCVQYEIPSSRNYGSNVRWEVLFNGKRVPMQGQTSTCEEPHDPALEALILEYDTVRIESGKPVVTRLPDRPTSAIQACAGRCLVYQGPGSRTDDGGIVHIDTGKITPFPKLARAPLSLSPDERVLVSAGDAYGPDQKTSYKFCVNDLETKTAVEWTVPIEQKAKFEWKRDTSGRDVLVPPAPSPGTKSRPMAWGCPPDKAPFAP